MSQEDAFRILETPLDKLSLSSDYYKAVFHLAKYPGIDTEKALLRVLNSNSQDNSVQLARRKAVEILARLGCRTAIPVIGECLNSKDVYLVENAAWALKKLDCHDSDLHLRMIRLLDDPRQNRRILIQSLSELKVVDSIEKIKSFLADNTVSLRVRGSCLAAICRLCGDREKLIELENHLLMPNQNDRYLAVQDIINSRYIEFLPAVIKAPVAISFRLRAVNALWNDEQESYDGINLLEILDSLIQDQPNNINILHSYNCKMSKDSLIGELFGTDFSRCYLALKILIQERPCDLWPIIRKSWDKFKRDYGALYFLILLFRYISGWNELQAREIENMLLFALDDSWPEYMKFKPAAVITLMQFNSNKCLKYIPRWLDPNLSTFWPTRYAALFSIQLFFSYRDYKGISSSIGFSKDDPHRFVRARAIMLEDKFNRSNQIFS